VLELLLLTPPLLHQGRDLSEARVLELAEHSLCVEIRDGASSTEVRSVSTERCSVVGEGTSRVKGVIVFEGMGLNNVSIKNSVSRIPPEEARPSKDGKPFLRLYFSSGSLFGSSINSNSRRNRARWKAGLAKSPVTWARISPFWRGGAL